ncbi:MAG: response regulator transcription factor [bacterium]|nr:response regulator transcription factor [bacterium]
MQSRQILVIEDDAAIRQGIVDALRCEGYAVSEAGDGDEGVRAALGSDCDLLLLDLVLPDADGFDILRTVRADRPALPVIILTARGAEDERVRGLRLGADDYVVKPFSVRELLARVEAVLRRAPDAACGQGELAFAGGAVDLESGAVQFDGDGGEQLSDRETALLRYLAANADRAVTRDEILAHVWGFNAQGIETRTVDMHVARLREKLRDDAAQPRLIHTVRGKGYRFVNGAGRKGQ